VTVRGLGASPQWTRPQFLSKINMSLIMKNWEALADQILKQAIMEEFHKQHLQYVRSSGCT
jgi:hypothetical protein